MTPVNLIKLQNTRYIWCVYSVYIGMCGPTCEVFLSELNQWENHAVGHLVGQDSVERIQLSTQNTTKQIIH